MKIIVPKQRYEWRRKDGPLFFLAGPIRGGGDWQTECCRELARHGQDFCIATPSLWTAEHPMSDHFVTGLDRFDYQLDWERHYLELASQQGCILFWLPVERPESASTRPSKAYARDTRGELGEWRGRMMENKSIRLVIGAEADFDGLDVIRRNFDAALGEKISIHGTLDETVRAAIAKAPNLP